MKSYTKSIYYNEINPYLRYARQSIYVPVNEWLCALDYHFYFLFSDECILKIENEKYLLKNGTVVIIPPGVRYCFKKDSAIDIASINFDYTQFNSHITVPVSPIEIDNFKEDDIIEKIAFKDNECLNTPVVLEDMDCLKTLIKNIIAEYNYKKEFYKELSSGLFKQILLEMLRETISEDKNTGIINTAIHYINNHCCEEIDNQKVAEVVGYHSYYLNRLVKETTGTTIKQLIIGCRLEAAKKYLKETNLSILEISERCGYKNFSNFSRDFKRRCGVSPNIYRRDRKHLLHYI